MRASSWVTLPGTTHASIEYSPVAVISWWSLRLAVVEACALPVRMLMPQPPTQVTSPESCRSAAGSTPLVSNAVVPWPVLNSYSAMRLFS